MEPIAVIGTEFYCKENAKVHHTQEYDLVEAEQPTPILRRGEAFYVALRFNRPFEEEQDALRIILNFGR